ncbi:DEKNAAC101273 [Brettanomyces naardenensis]|uniref:DEKNAAC101273 n=1 Tax=Brettanomyces naardenensis TaxID=13370 RepID=A0A448YHX1_BRENA|nr:DEKNAAC101273 [Brettanomyces naardenensis]
MNSVSQQPVSSVDQASATDQATTAAAVAAAAAAAAATAVGNNSSVEEEVKDEAIHDDRFERRYICPVCHHSFTRKHNLKSHRLIHTDEKPFACTHCPRRFRRLHDMKRHEKLHSHEKPFVCSKCGKGFARGDALLRHQKSSSGCPANGARKKRKADGAAEDVGLKRDKAGQSESNNSRSVQQIAADAANYFEANPRVADPDAKNSNDSRGNAGLQVSATDPALFLETGTATLDNADSVAKAKMVETISLLQSKIKSLEKTVAVLQAERDVSS